MKKVTGFFANAKCQKSAVKTVEAETVEEGMRKLEEMQKELDMVLIEAREGEDI